MKNKFKMSGFSSSEELVDELSEKLASLLKDAIETRGRACMAVSGGSTPKKLFEKLSTFDLDWAKVTITLVDERWVDVNSSQSNEFLVKESLLQNQAQNAKFISLKNEMIMGEEALLITRNRLKSVDKLDVVVLGMGGDAHTASFFPNMEELEDVLNAKESCCSSTASVEPYSRITLSRSFLLSAERLILHIEGENKKKVFDVAFQSDDYKNMPIISMMRQEKPLMEVYYA